MSAGGTPSAVETLSFRQRWAAVAKGMQEDRGAYSALHALLSVQFHAALRHDAPAMEQVAQQITAQVQLLDHSRRERSQHVRALLPGGHVLSMASAFAQLQQPLRQQLQQLWTELEDQVQSCQTLNLRNCQLIMEQADLMRSVIAGQAQPEIYAPL